MTVARTVFVTLDCADPAPVAAFWAAMLDGEVGYVSDRSVGVRTGWMWIAAMRVPDYEPPTWPEAGVPKQIHLDLPVEDLGSAVAEAVRLGATEHPTQPEPDRWRVLLDPAGHPFCLTTAAPAEVFG